MSTSTIRGRNLNVFSGRFHLRRGLAFGAIIVGALLAFEIFNYSTTEFALSDLLGELEFAGIRWATILAVAFCGIDFAGIARLFTPEDGVDEPAEVWYLFGAWLLAATMNAMLTWWGVSIAILSHDSLGNEVIARETLLKVVPIFVALIVWLIRVLIIGTFSVAGERLFSQADQPAAKRRKTSSPRRSTARQGARPLNGYRAPAARSASAKSAPRPSYKPRPQRNYRPDPTYEPVKAPPRNNNYGNANNGNGGYNNNYRG